MAAQAGFLISTACLIALYIAVKREMKDGFKRAVSRKKEQISEEN